MEVLPIAAAWAVENLSPQRVLKAIGIASLLQDNSPIFTLLGPQLSREAAIWSRSSPNFANKTRRWSERYDAPEIAVVVDVADAEDARKTVQWTYDNQMPWIAMNGGHGNTKALSGVRDGVQIDMRRLNQVEISNDGRSANIGAGATVEHVVSELFNSGKQTVTGICDCVGITGAALGGGHGWLQGQYGLMIDQIIQADMILPNGTAITVSEASHPDLFWAVRGAGHNFGLVTNFKYKIYDVDPKHTWSWEFLFFRHDQLEAVFSLAKELSPTHHTNLVDFIFWMSIPEMDPAHPITVFTLIYDGPASWLADYVKPFRTLGPVHTEKGEDVLTDLATRTYQGVHGPGCARGFTDLRFPTVLRDYNVTAIRKAYDDFDEMMQTWPQLNGSVYLLERYSTDAVKAVPDESTAFPHRDYDLLFCSFLIYKPNETIDQVAADYGKRMRQHIVDGSDEPTRLNVYVNYAHGDEQLPSMYGWEDWRLEKLRMLKRKYDPQNVLRWYAPIIPT